MVHYKRNVRDLDGETVSSMLAGTSRLADEPLEDSFVTITHPYVRRSPVSRSAYAEDLRARYLCTAAEGDCTRHAQRMARRPLPRSRGKVGSAFSFTKIALPDLTALRELTAVDNDNMTRRSRVLTTGLEGQASTP